MLTVDALMRAAIAAAVPKSLPLGDLGTATRVTSTVACGALRVAYGVHDGRVAEVTLVLEEQDADAPSPAWVERVASEIADMIVAELRDGPHPARATSQRTT